METNVESVIDNVLSKPKGKESFIELIELIGPNMLMSLDNHLLGKCLDADENGNELHMYNGIFHEVKKHICNSKPFDIVGNINELVENQKDKEFIVIIGRENIAGEKLGDNITVIDAVFMWNSYIIIDVTNPDFYSVYDNPCEVCDTPIIRLNDYNKAIKYNNVIKY